MAFRTYSLRSGGMSIAALERCGLRRPAQPTTPNNSFYQTRSCRGVSMPNQSASPGVALFAPSFETLVDSLGLLRGDRDFLILLAQFLVHEGDGVVPRRKPLNLVLSRFVGDRIERTLHHADVHLHPGMLVALHGQHDFFAGEILFDCGGRGRLRLVPLAVVFR